MAVNSETIEIRLSGLRQIDQLRDGLIAAQRAADAALESIARLDDEIAQGGRYARQLRSRSEALASVASSGQQLLNNPQARRSIGSAGRRRLQQEVQAQRAEAAQARAEQRAVESGTYLSVRQRRSQQRFARFLGNRAIELVDGLAEAERQVDDARNRAINELRQSRRSTRIRGTRSLIQARLSDSRRLGQSSDALSNALAERDRNITQSTERIERENAALERNQLAAYRAYKTLTVGLRRQRGVASRAGNVELIRDINDRLRDYRNDLERELDVIERTRSAQATDLGRLNQRRRSLRSIGKGRRIVEGGAEYITSKAEELRNLYGATSEQLRVRVGERRIVPGTIAENARRLARREDIEGAKDLIGLAKIRLVDLERELKLNNGIADAAQKRSLALQKINDQLASLRTAGASGSRMQEFEQLAQQVQEVAGSRMQGRNMPAFNRLLREALAAGARVEPPKGFMRGPSAPLLGEKFIEGSPKNIAARETALLRIEEFQQKIDRLSAKGASGVTFDRLTDSFSRLAALASSNNFRQFDQLASNIQRLLRIASGQIQGQAGGAGNRAKAEASVIKNYEKTASAVEQLELANERAANRAAGLYDDTDLKQFLNGLYQTEEAAKGYLDQLDKTYKLEDERRKANEKGATRTQQLARLEKNAAVAAEQLAVTEERAANLAAGLYDDSDLSNFLQGLYKREEFAKSYLDQLEGTFKLEDQRRKANEKGATKSEQRLDRENSQMLAIEKRQKKLAELQAAGVTGPALQRAQSLVEKLPGLAARGAGGAGEFRRVEKQAAQALGFATPRRGAGAGGGKVKTPEQIARSFARELSSAQVAEQNLINLSRKNVNVSSELVSVQNAINQAKSLGTSISEKDLEILKDQVATARDFVKVENARLANAQKGSNLKALKAASENRLPSLQRDTLTSGLIELGRADTAAKVFRGGRSGEQALSDAIKAFNAATGPSPRQGLLAPGSTGGRALRTQKGVPIEAGAAAEAGAAGQNVAKTLSDAISAGTGIATSAGTKLASAITKAIERVFDINSPSGWAIGIAKNVISTLAGNISAGVPVVQSALRDLLRFVDQYSEEGRAAASASVGRSFDFAVKSPALGANYDTLSQAIADLTINSSLYKKRIESVGLQNMPTRLLSEASGRGTLQDLMPELKLERMFRQLPGTLERMLDDAFVKSANKYSSTRFVSSQLSPTMAGLAGASQLNPGILFSSAGRLRAKTPQTLSGSISAPIFGASTSFPNLIGDPWTTPPSFRFSGGIAGRKEPSIVPAFSAPAFTGRSSNQSFGSTSTFSFGGGGRPPIPPAGAGGAGDLEGRIQGARGNAERLLGLADMADLSQASNKQLQLFSAALAETRDGLKTTDAAFNKINKVLDRTDDALARRDPNADLLVRGFGRRGGQAVGEGLIGGAFPLLFGQGGGAALGGGVGGALGGFAGGTLGFGLSLAGTAIGSQVDALAQAAQDTGNMLRDLVGNFEQIKEAGLLASRQQEKLVGDLIEAGNKTAAYAIIQAELNTKLGVDGTAKLKAAADAGDQLKRAMADLGLELQLFVSGPLTAFLKAVAGALEERNRTERARQAFENIPQNERNRFIEELSRENVRRGGSAQLIQGGEVLSQVTEKLSAADIQQIAKRFLPAQAPRQLTPEEQRQENVRNSETRRSLAQTELDILNKASEPREILKGLKQQATAIGREQQDIDRQSFELRRDYEKQIGDIRRGIEDRIAQVRQENAQKELEILVKQGQIREQQFKNAADALRNSLAGDDLAQELADAVTSYLGAQLSAENQLQQLRKKFEIEITTQQIEADKYKAEVARNVAQLNLSTTEKVQEINRNIARRNEDAALNNFELEKKIAKLRIRVANEDLLVQKANLRADIAGVQAVLQQQDLTPDQRKTYTDLNFVRSQRLREINEAIGDFENYNKKIDELQAPPRLRQIAPLSTRSVNFAGIDQAIAQGGRLREEVLSLETALIELGQTGSAEALTARLQEIFIGPSQALEKSLLESRKALGEAANDFSLASEQISTSYLELIQRLAESGKFKITPDFLGLIAASRAARLGFEELRPSIQFFSGAFDDLTGATNQARQSISDLLRPAKAYDAVLEQINSRGGLGINPEEEQQLLSAARALDDINKKLEILNGLRDIAAGWTDSFIQLNKELLKGGNLLDSVQRFAESVADRTLDVVLEFTLRPIQERLFKNLTDFLGVDKEKNPLLLPVQQIRETLSKFYEGAKGSFMQDRQSAAGVQPPAQPAAAPFRAPTPEPAPLPPGARSSALTGQFTGVGGPDLPASMAQGGVQRALKLTDEEIAAAVNTAIGEYGGRDPLGRTDVFANILSRSRSGQYPKNLVDVVTQAGQYAPNFGLSREQVINPNRYGRQIFEQVKAELLNQEYLQQSLRDVNGRLFFKGVSQYPNMMQGDWLRAEGQNFFHGPGRQLGVNPQITSQLMSELGGVQMQGQQPLPSTTPVTNDVPALMQQFSIAIQEATAALTAFKTASGDSATATATSAQITERSGEKLSASAEKFQTIVGTGLQAIAGIAMGIGGAQMIKKGGAYNTLMGAASIFGSISSLTGMFGTGGPLSGLFGKKAAPTGPSPFTMPQLTGAPGMRALGGPVFRGEEYLVGEEGPEVIRMGANGTVIPADDLYIPGLDDRDSGGAPPIGRYARRSTASSEADEAASEQSINSQGYIRNSTSIYTGNYGRTVPYQRSESSREIDRLERVTSSPSELPPIKYETTRVNEYDFVTPEQLEASNMRTAKVARNQTIRELADSLKTRKRLGL